MVQISFDGGCFSASVPLGELRTDEAGHLLCLGAWLSQSRIGALPTICQPMRLAMMTCPMARSMPKSPSTHRHSVEGAWIAVAPPIMPPP